MKRLLALLAATAFLTGCGGNRPVLHVYNWADYMEPELIREFEKEHGCRVVVDYYDSNEVMYAKLRAGGGGYDVIFPSSYMVNMMHEQDMLLELDHSLLPNIGHIDPAYLKFTMDPQMHHSVPYMVGTTGLGYLQSRVENFEDSWAMLGRADLAGRMTMLNDMRETIGAALKFLGYSLNSTDDAELEQARDVVIGWKRNLAKFESEQYKNGLVSAEFFLSHGYSGDILQAMDENEDVAYVIPREGVSIASDDMVIPRTARQVELAHAFINFLHRPEVAARNIEFVFYLCPNLAAYGLVDEEVRQDASIFLPPELLEKCETAINLGDDNAKYVRIWDQIKAAE